MNKKVKNTSAQTTPPVPVQPLVEKDVINRNLPKYATDPPVLAHNLEVKVYNNFDKAIKAFRALVQKERILSIYKEKQSYEKPSVKRRRKRNEMKRKIMELEGKVFGEKKLRKHPKDPIGSNNEQ
jgi:ribosomal protein S21